MTPAVVLGVGVAITGTDSTGARAVTGAIAGARVSTGGEKAGGGDCFSGLGGGDGDSTLGGGDGVGDGVTVGVGATVGAGVGLAAKNKNI